MTYLPKKAFSSPLEVPFYQEMKTVQIAALCQYEPLKARKHIINERVLHIHAIANHNVHHVDRPGYSTLYEAVQKNETENNLKITNTH